MLGGLLAVAVLPVGAASARGAAPGTAAPAAPAAPTREPTKDILARLGGRPCPDGSEFTCVTVPMPLDHFDPSDTADDRRHVRREAGHRRAQGRVRHRDGRPGLLRHQRGRLLHVVLRAQRPPPVRPRLLRSAGPGAVRRAHLPSRPRPPTTGPTRRPARRPRSGRSRRPPAGSAPTARSRPAAPTCCPTWARRRRPRTSSPSASSSRTTGGGSTASRTARSSPRPTPPPTRSTSAGWCSTAPST